MKTRGTSGKHLGKPPYGYQPDPQDKDHWILDEDAAPVVKRIFDLAIAGAGPSRIARILEADGVLTTKALYAQRRSKPMPERPCHWVEQSVVGILERMEYTGCVCNVKTYSKSYKLKKRIPNTSEDMFVLPDTQEAIVPKEQWDRVQELRQHKRRMTKAERQGLFSGLVVCADCGSKLHFATCKNFDGKQDHYVCAKYKSGRGTCSAHYIREDVLRDVVLERIRAVTEYIRADVEGFQEDWLMCRREEQEKSIREDKRRLEKAKKRLTDIDKLITRIYEDMVLGNLSQERYQKMLEGYEAEQDSLNNEIIGLDDWVATREEMEDNVDQFLALLEKYVDIPDLTQTIVNEFIKQIFVYAPDKSSGKRTQKDGVTHGHAASAANSYLSLLSLGITGFFGKSYIATRTTSRFIVFDKSARFFFCFLIVALVFSLSYRINAVRTLAHYTKAQKISSILGIEISIYPW